MAANTKPSIQLKNVGFNDAFEGTHGQLSFCSTATRNVVAVGPFPPALPFCIAIKRELLAAPVVLKTRLERVGLLAKPCL